jgi:shikimate dehydrogenase
MQTAAADEGARQVVVISRSGENNYENIDRHADANVIVNTTPVGMFPNNGVSPVDLSLFKNRPAVLDLIYNPRRTALLMQAEALGLKNGNGLTMLVAQGKRSAEQFLRSTLDERIIDRVTAQILQQQTNIVLIGMPGCGKSTVAVLLGKMLNRAVYDTDAAVEAAEGKTIPCIFAESGEAAFRNAETAACEALGKQLGAIIATGGGAVLRERNRSALRQNGTIVYLRRPVAELARDGRPLSEDKDAVAAIYAQRKELYESFADFTIDVDADAQITAERVISCISL